LSDRLDFKEFKVQLEQSDFQDPLDSPVFKEFRDSLDLKE